MVSDYKADGSAKLYMIDIRSEMTITIPTSPILNYITHIQRNKDMLYWSEGSTIMSFRFKDSQTQVIFQNNDKGKI